MIVCRAKTAGSSGCESHLATGRSSRKQSERGEEATTLAETLPMKKGRFRRLSEPAGRNASERRAGLETVNVGADPSIVRGRPLLMGEDPSDRRPISPTGVLATACMTRNPTGTREAQAVRA